MSRALLEVSLLNHYFRENPQASWEAAVTHVNQWKPFLDHPNVNSSLPLDRYMESIAQVAKEASGHPFAKAAFSALGALYKHTFEQNLADEERRARDGEASASTMARLQGVGVADLDRAKEILSEARAHGDENGAYAAAYYHLVGNQIGIDIKDSGAEILEKVPVLNAVRGIEELKDGQGGIRTTLGRIETFFRRELRELHQEIEGVDGKLVGIQDRLTTLEAGQQELLGYARDAEERRKKAAKEALAAAESQQRIDAAGAAIFLFSLIGDGDPQVGESIRALGTATVQIATSLNQWSKAIANLGATEALTSMSTVIMTGNVVGAVMTLMPLLVDSGPSADELILEGIGKLRDDVAELRSEMGDRFDHVDRTLSLVYNKLGAGLAEINLSTGRIERGVKAMHDDLIRMQTDLHRFEKGMYDLVRDQEQRSLLLRADGALGLRARSLGTATMSQDDYLAHESFFWTWGQEFAFDRVAMGWPVGERSYADEKIYDELRSQPLEANVGYLSELARRWGARPFATGRAGNSQQWVLGANAYSQLAMEWPQHARQVARGRFEALYQTGTALLDPLRRIANIGTAAAPEANRDLFARALANYKSKTLALHRALSEQENAWHASQRRDVDPFAGRDQLIALKELQPLPGEPGDPWPGQALCGRWKAEMLSEGAVRAMLPPAVLLAKSLGSGDARLCVRRVAWVDWETEETPRFEIDSAVPAFQVASQYREAGSEDWEDVIVKAGRGSRRNVCWRDIVSPTPPPRTCLDVNTVFEGDWGVHELRQRFERDGVEVSRGEAVIERAGTAVDGKLIALQALLYTRLSEAFGSGPVREAAVALSGAHAALTDLTALGLPRVLLGDELLKSLLYGDQRLLDHQLARELYVAALNPPDAPAWSWLNTGPYLRSPGRNIREAMAEIGEARLAALQERLQIAFGALERGESQTYPILERALDRLAGAQAALAARVIAEPPPDEPPVVKEPARQPASRLKVLARKRLRLRVQVPAAGRLAATARRGAATLARAPERPVKAGKRSLTLRLTKAGRRALARGRRAKVTIRVIYTPDGAKAQTTTLAATLRLR